MDLPGRERAWLLFAFSEHALWDTHQVLYDVIQQWTYFSLQPLQGGFEGSGKILFFFF